jgi:cytochrome c-type biogenesis protein CcmH
VTSIGFWLTAVLLAAAAFAFLAVPLWRHRRQEGRWSVVGLGAAIVTVPLAVVLYLAINTWEADADADLRANPRAMVAQLAARLAQNPDDATGWRMLGRGYRALGEYEMARQAFQEAWARTPNPDSDLTLSLAEAQVLSDPRTLLGEAGRLIEEVLAVESNNPTALWYGGLLAREQGQADLARTRWNRLLELFNPPPEISSIIREELARMEPGASPQAGASSRAGGPAAAPPREGNAGTFEGIRLRVSLGEGASLEALGPRPALFVFARVPGERAPLAVLREGNPVLPAEIVLSDDHAMLPGRSLGDFDELTLVARLSASGDALEQPGDLYAQARYTGEQNGVVELVIDQVVE